MRQLAGLALAITGLAIKGEYQRIECSALNQASTLARLQLPSRGGRDFRPTLAGFSDKSPDPSDRPAPPGKLPGRMFSNAAPITWAKTWRKMGRLGFQRRQLGYDGGAGSGFAGLRRIFKGGQHQQHPRIEGLPHGLHEYWGEESGITDIYQHLSVMLAHSDTFILLPGGAGTLQELLALLLLLRDQKNPLMRHLVHQDRPKNIVLVNLRLDGAGRGFYDPIIELIQLFGYVVDQDFHVVTDEMQAINQLDPHRDIVDQSVGGRQRPSDIGRANV